jgi:gamma-glutamyltranspeptidase/glutathione hydrolase
MAPPAGRAAFLTEMRLQETRAVKSVKMRRFPLALASLSLVVSPLLASHPVMAKHAMVVAQEPQAVKIGVEVLQGGGNAVDAVIAVAFALSVTYPTAGNLGGGGFHLVRMADGRNTFLDFRESAPLNSSRDMYLDTTGAVTKDSVIGWRAAGVPGTVRGLEHAHKKFGTWKWAGLLRPSIQLAAKGFPVSYALSQSLRSSTRLPLFAESKRIYLNNDKGFEVGDTFRQPELAAVLSRIAKHGARDFYEGETARKFAQAMSENGGALTLEDLKAYTVSERAPLTGTYRGLQILTAPPPSSGGIGLLQMCKVLEGTDYQKTGAGSARAVHFVAEAMRRYYADRSEHLGDPDFVRVPQTGLLASGYIDKLRASIDPEKATPSSEIRPGNPGAYESSETTHISIVDQNGNAAALTYTLNGTYGSGVTVPGLGFLLNNEMDDFSAKPGTPNMFGLLGGDANAIQPRKRPLSSMTPAIVLRGGAPYIVLGAPGGSRIITAVLQVFLNIVDFGLNVQEAIDRPRFHHQWQPDVLLLESAFSPDTVELLKARGHNVGVLPLSDTARVEAIVVDGGWLQGGTDSRAWGQAAGY